MKQLISEGKLPEIHVRIGVHYGATEVGNIGSDDRFDYTAVGDLVNTASRLEGLYKAFGTEIVVSGEVFDAAHSEVPLLPLGSVRVAGRKQSLRVFSPIAVERDENRAKWVSAVESVKNGELQAARVLFAEVRASEPLLKTVADLYLKNIEYVTQSREFAGKPWDGVLVFEVK